MLFYKRELYQSDDNNLIRIKLRKGEYWCNYYKIVDTKNQFVTKVVVKECPAYSYLYDMGTGMKKENVLYYAMSTYYDMKAYDMRVTYDRIFDEFIELSCCSLVDKSLDIVEQCQINKDCDLSRLLYTIKHIIEMEKQYIKWIKLKYLLCVIGNMDVIRYIFLDFLHLK